LLLIFYMSLKTKLFTKFYREINIVDKNHIEDRLNTCLKHKLYGQIFLIKQRIFSSDSVYIYLIYT